MLGQVNLVIWKMLILWGVVDVTFGLSYGLSIPWYLAGNSTPSDVVVRYTVGGFCAAAALGWTVRFVDVPDTRVAGNWSPGQLSIQAFALTLVGGIVFPMAPELSKVRELSKLTAVGVCALIVLLRWLGLRLGNFLGRSSRLLARSGSQVFSEVGTLGAAGAFFLVGYFFITLMYSSVFAVLWRANHAAFSGDGLSSDPSLLDFMYFSAVTLTTLGYGDIVPKSDGARLLAMSEMFVGMAWVTVVLSATVARLGLSRSKSSDV